MSSVREVFVLCTTTTKIKEIFSRILSLSVVGGGGGVSPVFLVKNSFFFLGGSRKKKNGPTRVSCEIAAHKFDALLCRRRCVRFKKNFFLLVVREKRKERARDEDI